MCAAASPWARYGSRFVFLVWKSFADVITPGESRTMQPTVRGCTAPCPPKPKTPTKARACDSAASRRVYPGGVGLDANGSLPGDDVAQRVRRLIEFGNRLTRFGR